MKKLLSSLMIVAILVSAFVLCANAADDIVFDFTSKGNANGWAPTNCTLLSVDGHLKGSATPNVAGNYDPYIRHSFDFSADDYRYVVARMSTQTARSKGLVSQLFFSTETRGYSEATSIVQMISEDVVGFGTGEGKYITICFDMALNEYWQGKVTGLRWDFMSGEGDFQIDWIKILSEEPAEYDVINVLTKESSDSKVTGVFEKTTEYVPGTFADVPENEWFYNAVVTANELGFVKGTSDTTYAPKQNFTVNQAFALAARIHSIYNGGDGVFEQDPADWAKVYTDYAKENGYFDVVTFDNYNRPIKRWEMAMLYANLLPNSSYSKINSVYYIPDIDSTAAYAPSIFKLYNAGIVMGNDDKGTFNPDKNITRAEVAAIVNRIAISEDRVKKTLKTPERVIADLQVKEEGYYLSDYPNLIYGEDLRGGWNYNTQANKPIHTKIASVLDDVSIDLGNYLIKEFQEVTGGPITVETSVQYAYESNGSYETIYDNDGKRVYYLFTENGMFYLLGRNGEKFCTGRPASIGGSIKYRVYIDLDAQKYTMYFDGSYVGEFDFVDDTHSAKYYKVGSTEEGIPCINKTSLFIWKDYFLNENFFLGALPDEMEEEISGEAVATYNEEVSVTLQPGAKYALSSYFGKASGNIVYENYYYLDKVADGLKFALKADDKDVFSITIKDGKYVTGKGEVLNRDLVDNIWNILRIEADTATSKAIVKINGRVVGTSFDFDNASDIINTVEVSFDSKNAAILKMDETKVFKLFEYEDYVPEPVPAESKDYILGINICSLWREGYHMGWDKLTPYDEIKPVLGWYDEGIPEVVDWEIKYWAEHGIDYGLYCWYGKGTSPVKPKRGGEGSAIHSGYWNAKYTDYVKYAIMYENAASGCNFEQFVDNVIPVWLEYYFKDPRYMVINNRPLVTYWTPNNFVSQMGSEENAGKAYDLLNQACIDAGFDGVLLVTSAGEAYQQPRVDAANACKAEGMYAYHFSRGGVNYFNQINAMKPFYAPESEVGYVPCVSVGFNSIGWAYNRTGLIPPENYHLVTDWIKSDALPHNKGKNIEGMVMISTWNEYGEGTYMMPSESLGFAYLDEVRKAFTDAPEEHEDVTPTDAQKARICKIYPQDRQIIGPMLYEKMSAYPTKAALKLDLKPDKWTIFGFNATYNSASRSLVLETTASANKILIYNGDVSGIDTSKVSYLKVRMKYVPNTDAETIQPVHAFFTTTEFPELIEARRTICDPVENTSEVQDVYVQLSKNAGWHGKLTSIRIDIPIYNDTVVVESVELIQNSVDPVVIVNDVTMNTYGKVKSEGGHFYINFWPVASYNTPSYLRMYHEWDKNTKTLTLGGNKHEIVLTIGSDKAIVDGVEKTLPKAIETFDNLPVLPIDVIAEYLGYTVEQVGMDCVIKMPALRK